MKAATALNLIIQPPNYLTSQFFEKLGFQPLPEIPLLLYKPIVNAEIINLFQGFGKALPTTELAGTRFLLTRSPHTDSQIAIEFLQAQPLLKVIQAAKNAWFFNVIFQQNLFFQYQPIFNLQSGKIFAYECLARAKDNNLQIKNGKELVDAALETQLIYDFDELARSTCVESIAALKSNQIFFINILPNALVNNPLAFEQNLKQIERAHLKPSQIVFELTELQAIATNRPLLKMLHQIRQQGFGIAIDDLCSNTNLDHYFLEYHPDIIKIDRQIVHGCSNHPIKGMLFKAIVASAHELGCLAIAEGLENPEDIKFCRNLGVDMGQGFGLAMPGQILRQEPLNHFTPSIKIAS
ncbi:MAG: EAL domain-containing protein [Oscillatoria sp. PMC 1051.18]|nr:EAL domain-containing protein [Oscillatoria sp. PMC 1050.18]MEC5030954.1 EAL domain-containing protein [Oscillatoria sp. PMC 1051.18]